MNTQISDISINNAPKHARKIIVYQNVKPAIQTLIHYNWRIYWFVFNTWHNYLYQAYVDNLAKLHLSMTCLYLCYIHSFNRNQLMVLINSWIQSMSVRGYMNTLVIITKFKYSNLFSFYFKIYKVNPIDSFRLSALSVSKLILYKISIQEQYSRGRNIQKKSAYY